MSGAGPVRTALRISLPVIGPAILSAALLVLIIAAAMYSIPAIIGTSARIQTISVYIVNLTLESAAGLSRAVAAALVLVVFITSAWLAQRWITQRQKQMTITGKSTRGAIVRLGRWRRPAQASTCSTCCWSPCCRSWPWSVVALQPFWQATIDPRVFTLKRVILFFTSDTNKLPREALSTSLRLGAVGATLVMLAATILITYAHHADRRIGNFIRGVTKIPSAISGLVIAVAILFTFAGPPFSLKGTFLILLLAYLVMFMPQASLAAEAARGQVGDELLEASLMAGSSRMRTSLRILWPLMRPGLVYGWSMIFVLILGDLIAASVLAGPGNQVVGSAIVEIYTGGIFSDLAVLSLIVTLRRLDGGGAGDHGLQPADPGSAARARRAPPPRRPWRAEIPSGRRVGPASRAGRRARVRRALVNARVLDGSGARIRSGLTVTLEDERIVDVGPAREPSPGTEVIDLGGRVLMPGLIDCHIHFALWALDPLGHQEEPFSYLCGTTYRALEGALRAGCTAARDPGGLDAGFRDAVNDGTRLGPRIQTSITIVSPINGIADGTKSQGPGGAVSARHAVAGVHGPVEARAKVREVIRAGADFIKIAATGGVSSRKREPRQRLYTEEEILTIVDEAHAWGRPVVCHALGGPGAAHGRACGRGHDRARGVARRHVDRGDGQAGHLVRADPVRVRAPREAGAAAAEGARRGDAGQPPGQPPARARGRRADRVRLGRRCLRPRLHARAGAARRRGDVAGRGDRRRHVESGGVPGVAGRDRGGEARHEGRSAGRQRRPDRGHPRPARPAERPCDQVRDLPRFQLTAERMLRAARAAADQDPVRPPEGRGTVSLVVRRMVAGVGRDGRGRRRGRARAASGPYH